MKKLLLTTSGWLMFYTFVAGQPETQFSLETYLQQNNLRTQLADDGLRYILERPGNGLLPKEGDYARIRFKAMLLDSTVFEQSDDKDPFIFKVGNREVIKGLDKGIRLLKKGSKARFYIPAALGYMQYGVGKTVPPNSPLIYDVELVEIMNFGQYDSFMRRLEERERMEYEQEQKQQFQKDLALLAAYATDNKLKTQRTASGLSYVITKPGKGENAKPGNRLKVAYEGFLVSGAPIERSSEGKPYEFFLGSGRVLDGWEEGLQFFNKGSEGWLLIPSKLAYGPLEINENDIYIPANSALVFKIKVLDVLKQ